MFDLTGRSCLVIGGTSGIGRTLALALRAAGARVTVGSSSTDKVGAMAEEIGERSVVEVDVRDESSVAAAVEQVVSKDGRLDVMVNTAGVTIQRPAIDMELDDWKRVLDVNLTGSFVACRAAGRTMMKQAPRANGERGCILNIASMASFVGLADVAAYASSKAGVVALTKSLANDWAGLGIRVNALAPGFFVTDMNRGRLEGTARGDWVIRQTPLGRFGRAEELTGAALYLCSDAASFTTGEVMVVDGGFLARGIGS